MNAIASNPYLLTALIVAAMFFVMGMTAILVPKIDVHSVRQLSRLFVGYKVPPIVVSFARRGLTAFITAIITGIANATGLAEGTDLVAVGAGVAGVIETLGWGMFDQLWKSGQNADNPPRQAGGQMPEVVEADARASPGRA